MQQQPSTVIPLSMENMINMEPTTYVQAESTGGREYKQSKIRLVGAQSWSVNNPQTTGNGQMQFEVPCGQDQIIETQNSYIKMQMSHAFLFSDALSAPFKTTPTGQTLNCLYSFVGGNWYKQVVVFPDAEPAELAEGVSPNCVLGAPEMICTGMQNAMCFFQKFVTQCGGETYVDDDIYRKFNVHQQFIPPDVQDVQNHTWFDGNKPVIQFDTIMWNYVDKGNKTFNKKPVKIGATNKDTLEAWEFTKVGSVADIMTRYQKDGWNIITPTNGDASHTTGVYVKMFYFDYLIPFNFLNSMFDADKIFLTPIISRSYMTLNLMPQYQKFCDIIGCQNYVDCLGKKRTFLTQIQNNAAGVKFGTGLIDIQLVMAQKTSPIVTQMLRSQQMMTRHFTGYDRQMIGGTVPQNSISQMVSNTHLSIKDLVIGLYQDDRSQLTDADNNDCAYIKGKASTLTALQMRSQINKGINMNFQTIINNDDYVFLWQYKVVRGNSEDTLFSEIINNPIEIMMENKRSHNLLSQYQVGATNAYANFNEFLLKYAYSIINLESWVLLNGSKDVQQDGYNSIASKLTVQLQLGVFKSGWNEGYRYDITSDTGLDANVRLSKNAFGFEIYNFYDMHLYYQPQGTKQVSVQEELLM